MRASRKKIAAAFTQKLHHSRKKKMFGTFPLTIFPKHSQVGTSLKFAQHESFRKKLHETFTEVIGKVSTNLDIKYTIYTNVYKKRKTKRAIFTQVLKLLDIYSFQHSNQVCCVQTNVVYSSTRFEDLHVQYSTCIFHHLNSIVVFVEYYPYIEMYSFSKRLHYSNQVCTYV